MNYGKIAAASVALMLGWASQAEAQQNASTSNLEKALNDDALAASVMTVTDSGDIILFGGAITVPAVRPSVERCGEWISSPLPGRNRSLATIRRKVTNEATRKRFSSREKMLYRKKALAPYKDCERLFTARCKEAKERVPLDARKLAVDDARKSIDSLLADGNKKTRIAGYLDTIVLQCKLEE